ncbi:MAG TPA: 2,3-diaminopropionate biosynthesis protein SbnA [Pyrinomonadaceae bacterium]|nr:2,3-diaminopropionate biosynthesis protein SbnA [Pyrinomonadaceae bacterium]
MRSTSEGVLSVVGNTPLVLLQRTYERTGSRLYAKLEGLNPGGSIKDRTAISILKHGIETGAIHPWTVVIESSSGNMGIGLAQACAFLKLRFICVVDPKTLSQNINILRTYGAEIDLVSQPDRESGEYLPARIRRVRDLMTSVEHGFWSAQYSNIYNAQAHHETMREIIAALDTDLDYLFCSTSTCGTLRGCAGYIREHKLRTKCIAVDALGSAIFGGGKAKRLIPGHGAAVIPPLFQANLAERFLHVSDLDCIIGCRRLVREEAILAGGSSGGVFIAAEKAENFIEPGSTCVAIFPDRGERYLNTIYSDTWVREHFGDVENGWLQAVPPNRELEFVSA